MSELLFLSKTAAQFRGRNTACLFYSCPGAVDDRHELAVGAKRYRLFIRVPDGDDRCEGLACPIVIVCN